jgi:hypothetical protein
MEKELLRNNAIGAFKSLGFIGAAISAFVYNEETKKRLFEVLTSLTEGTIYLAQEVGVDVAKCLEITAEDFKKDLPTVHKVLTNVRKTFVEEMENKPVFMTKETLHEKLHSFFYLVLSMFNLLAFVDEDDVYQEVGQRLLAFSCFVFTFAGRHAGVDESGNIADKAIEQFLNDHQALIKEQNQEKAWAEIVKKVFNPHYLPPKYTKDSIIKDV